MHLKRSSFFMPIVALFPEINLKQRVKKYTKILCALVTGGVIAVHMAVSAPFSVS